MAKGTINLPKGFVLDKPTVPEGFVLDAPNIPEGFVLDKPPVITGGADPNKPLNFIDSNIPTLDLPGPVDPQDVGLLPEQQIKQSRWNEARDAAAQGLAGIGSAGHQLVASFWDEPANIYGLKYPKDSSVVKANTERADRAKDDAAFLWELSKNPALAAQNTDITSKGIRLITGNLPYLTATTIGYVALGPMGGFAVGSLVEGNSAYRTTLDYFKEQNKGKPLTAEQKKLAAEIGTGVGIISGSIEAFGGKYAEQLMLKATARLRNKMLKAGAVFSIGTVIEALEEGGQEIAQLTGESIYRDVNWKEATTRTLGSMAGGAFLGGVMKGGGVSLRSGINAADEARGLGPRFDPEIDTPVDQARFDKDIAEMEVEQAQHMQAIAAERPQAPAQQPTQRLSPKDQARQDTRKKLLMGVPDAELEKRLRNTKVSSPFFREIYDEIVRRKEQTPSPEAAQATQPQIQPITEHEAVSTPQKPPQAITKPELARRGGAVEGAIHKKIQQLHDAPARIKGFELSRDAEVKKYFKNLRAAAKDKNLLQTLDDVERKEAEIQIIKAVDKAENLYYSGDFASAISESEKALQWIHERAVIQHGPDFLRELEEDIPQPEAVEGKVYHGTSTKVTELKEDTYSTVNIYGQGFYTTSEESVAKGYTKKGKGTAPAVHEVILNKGAEDKLFDMEQPITEDVKGIVREAFEDYGYVLDESSNLREAYDNFRDEATADGLSADSVQEYFEEAQKALEKKGYIGLKQKGGLQFKGKPHDVRIFWNPKRDLQLAPTKAVEAPTPKTVDELVAKDRAAKKAEISDEELGGITKPERRRLIKETAVRIEQSDIYQGAIESIGRQGEEVGGAGGLVFVSESGRGEVQEAVQNHPKLKFHITFDKSKGGQSWDQVIQEAGDKEMDLTEFLERYGKALESTRQEGGLNTAAIGVFEESGLPHEQLLAEKHRMLVAGFSDFEINNMISEWAEDNDQPPESMEDEYVSEYGTKIKRIKAMEPSDQDAALEQLATEQIEAEERSEAAKVAIEVLEANDIVPDVREVADISERPADLLGRPLLQGGAAGKQRGLGELGLEFKKPEVKDPDQLEFGQLPTKPVDDIPFERRGKPVGAAITQGQTQTILLAYGADSETGYHEAYHILRRRLKETDIKLLDKYFKGDEEAEARAFAKFAKTGEARQFLKGMWQRLKNILNRIKNQMQGLGYKTAEDVFDAIRKGTVEKVSPRAVAVKFETSGEKARREADKKARINARKARLAKRHGIKPKKVSRRRIKINIKDYTPPLREDLAPEEKAPLPRGKAIIFREPKYRKTMRTSPQRVPEDVLEANRQKHRIKESLKEIKRNAAPMAAGLERAANSISSRLFNIHPELKRRIRDLEEAKLGRIARDLKDIEPLMKGFKKMSRKDWKDMDLYLKNRDYAGERKMLDKYKLHDEAKLFREVDEGILEGANEVNMEIERLEGHFPRKVKLAKELMAFMKKTYGNTVLMTRFEAALAKRKEQAGGRELTLEEKAHVMNIAIRGFSGRYIWVSKPGGAKERSVFFIDDKINKFYYDSKKAAEMYIREMNDAIATWEFFGRETKQIQRLRAMKSRLLTRLRKLSTRQGLRAPMEEGKYKEHISKAAARLQEITQQLEDLKKHDLTQTIGGHIIDLVNAGLITDEQSDKVQSALEAYFNPTPMTSRVRLAKKIAYMTLIGTPIATATQLKDYARILYRAPLQAPGASLRAFVPGLKSKYTMDDLFLKDVISFDMSMVGGALNLNMRITGFRWLDEKMKEIYIDAVLTKFQRQARRKANLKEGSTFMERLQEVFGDKNDLKKVISDLKAKRKTALTLKLAFNQILDMHPIARSEMAETYLKGGSAIKYMYTLRQFGRKEFEFARNEIFRDMKKHPMRSVERLIWLAFTVALAGAGVEELRDLMRNRKTKLSDKILNSWLNMIFMSRYGINILKREGPAEGLIRNLSPPTRFIDAPCRDIMKGEFSETPRNIPLGGEFYYCWFGAGADKNAENTEGTGSE